MNQIFCEQKLDIPMQWRITSGDYSDKISTISIDDCTVTTFNGKVGVPTKLQDRIVEWYHLNLQHAGITRMVNTISQTFA
jgi:hypothetical protein